MMCGICGCSEEENHTHVAHSPTSAFRGDRASAHSSAMSAPRTMSATACTTGSAARAGANYDLSELQGQRLHEA